MTGVSMIGNALMPEETTPQEILSANISLWKYLKEITADTSGLTRDSICEKYNLKSDSSIEVVLPQETPSNSSLEKLKNAKEKGYSMIASYEILMTLLSENQEIRKPYRQLRQPETNISVGQVLCRTKRYRIPAP